MSYIKAEAILPADLLAEIQKYVSGRNIYIPAKQDNKLNWGMKSSYRQELKERNADIFFQYLQGIKVSELALRFYLSEKSIYRIIYQMKIR